MTASRSLGNGLTRITTGPRAFGWWGMVWLILTEAALFAMLLFSYFFIRFRFLEWPMDGIEPPSLILPIILTLILWSSSFAVHMADAGIRNGSTSRLRWGLGIGFGLGLVFLLLQGFVEYPEVLQEFSPQTNVYGSLFFGITGFHGFHVFVGLLISLWIQYRAWRGDFGPEHRTGVQVFGMYWHFVDVVWIFVFATVYLSPYL